MPLAAILSLFAAVALAGSYAAGGATGLDQVGLPLLSNGLLSAAAFVCARRASRVERDRAAWIAFAVAIASWTASPSFRHARPRARTSASSGPSSACWSLILSSEDRVSAAP